MPGEGGRVEDHWPLIPPVPFPFAHKSVGFAPPRFINLKETVPAFLFQKGQGAAGTLGTIDVEPSPDSEVVIMLVCTFVDGITVKKGDLYTGEEIIDVISRCENSNGLVFHDLCYAAQMTFIGTEQNRASRLNEPCCFVSSSADLLLQRPQNGIRIGYSDKKKILFPFHDG